MLIGLFSSLHRESNKSIRMGLQAIILVCILSMMQMAFIENNLITSLMIFRVAPLGVLFAFILIFNRLFVLFFEVAIKDFNWKDWWLLIFIIIYGLYQSVTSTYIGVIIFAVVSSLYIFNIFEFITKRLNSVFTFQLIKNRFSYPNFVLLILLSLIILGTLKNLVGLNQHYSDRSNYTSSGQYFYPYKKAEFELAEWTRFNTPLEAIFTVPSEISTFRINAQRGLIVDWTMSPSIPGDLEEWYRRIGDISGIDINEVSTIPSNDQLIDGYRNLDYSRAKFLKDKYGASYFVVNKENHLANIEKFDELFSNELYKIIYLNND
jgi:hypothetical protein